MHLKIPKDCLVPQYNNVVFGYDAANVVPRAVGAAFIPAIGDTENTFTKL